MRPRSLRHTLLPLCLLLLSLPARLNCQTTIGIQPLGSYQGSIDQINLADLSLHLDIPLFVHKARGANMGDSVHLIYDDSYYFMGPTGPDFGWRVVASSASGGTVTATYQTVACSEGNGTYQLWSYHFVDSTGYVHGFPGTSTYTGCTTAGVNPTTTLTTTPVDGSGYLLIATGQNATVTDPAGVTYYYQSGSNYKIIDTNGNVAYTGAAVDTSNVTFTVTGGIYSTSANGDYIGRTPTLVTYTDTTGMKRTITVAYGAYTVQGGATYRVSSVIFPDESTYQFGYQSTLGLGSVTLPAGGTIDYVSTAQTYCSGTSYTRTRTTPDGKTTYTHTINSASGNCILDLTSQTAIAKPDGSSEQVNFVTAYTNPSLLRLETAHSWLSSSGATLKSTMKCYNGAIGSCTTTAVSLPVTQISTATTMDTQASSKTIQYLNANGLPTEVDEYDYGSTSPSRKTITVYDSLGNNIADRPQTVTVEDGSGNPFSKTTYGYDEYTLPGLSLAPTSGLPSHVAATGSRGNQTSRHEWLNTTGGTLDTYRQFDDAGQVIRVEDPRQNWTTYAYDPATDSCLNKTTYPTPSSGVANVTSQICDPNTGLVSSKTDQNGTVTTPSYDLMLWPAGATVTSGSIVVANTKINYSSGSALPETITTTVTVTQPESDIDRNPG